MMGKRKIVRDSPSVLQRVMQQLEKTTHQEYSETRMESGHIKRARIGSPLPVFKGNVDSEQ